MIKWSKRAKKSIKKLPRDVQIKIIEAVEKLPKGDVKPLHGNLRELFRLRVGDWRVIYERIENGYLIHDVLHRSEAYK